MKILLVNYEYPPLGGGGGIAMMEIAEELAKRHSVHVLTSGAPGLDEVSKHSSLDLTVHRARVAGRTKRATASFLSMLDFLPSGIRLGNEILAASKFDIINTWFAIPSGIPGGWIAKKYQVPHVLTVIGGDIYDPSKWYSPHRFPLSGWAVKWALRRAEAYVAISSDIANRTKQYFGVAGRVPVVPLGMRVPHFNHVTREQLKLEPDKRYIVTVGRLVRRKDYPTLIKAISLLQRDDTELLMIGDGPEQENLQALATELGVADKVRFFGFVSNDDKFGILENSDIFVLASLHEGFGVVYLEAMFCGLPIVAADQGGQVDILEDGVTGGLVPIGNVDEMVNEIRALLEDADLRSNISRTNKNRAEDYTISRIAERYEETYESAIADRRSQTVSSSM